MQKSRIFGIALLMASFVNGSCECALLAQPGKAAPKPAGKSAATNADNDSLNPGAKPTDAAVLDHVRLLNSNSALSDRADMATIHNYLVSAIAAITNYFNSTKRGKPMGLSVQCNIAPGNVVLYELQARPVERQEPKMGVALTNVLEKLKAPVVTGPVGVQILMKVYYPKPEVTALIKKGLDLQKAGKNKEAVTLYSQAIALDPNNTDLFTCRGLAYSANGQYDLALADFSKTIGDGNNDVYLDRANCYRHLKQWDNALADSNKAIELSPETPDGYVSRAQIYIDKGAAADAIKDCNKILGFAPGNGMAYLMRGEGHQALKENEEAVRDLSKALEIIGASGEAYYYRGLANKDLGRQVDSEADSDNAKRLGYAPDPAK